MVAIPESNPPRSLEITGMKLLLFGIILALVGIGIGLDIFLVVAIVVGIGGLIYS